MVYLLVKATFSALVFKNPPRQGVGHSYIEPCGFTRQNVNVELSRECQSRFLTPFGMTNSRERLYDDDGNIGKADSSLRSE